MSEGGPPAAPGRLPETLPLFPLTGALLLPRGRLPLNIFEPRYLQMVEHALGAERLIGMVQPTEHEDTVARPPLYRTGCAGRISTFAETGDGRYLITLMGVSRFRIVEELPVSFLYRRARVSYDDFGGDRESEHAAIDRGRLLANLGAYLEPRGGEIDWEAIDKLDDDALVTALAMACPLAPNEKQALLEAADLAERAAALSALMEMAALNDGAGEAPTQ